MDLNPAMELLADRYRLDKLIGRGGMSDVYEATDVTSGTRVAVKIVRPGDPGFARRLSKEAEALEHFDHPGLVSMLDAGTSGDRTFLVMELIGGPTLASVLSSGKLAPADAAKVGVVLAGALDYVHSRGIVHRDVKPANVLMGPDGGAKLADFGIARLMAGSTVTATGTTLGTTSYMAPEQLENHQVGPPADIWSLGIVLLECLTGRRVYEGTPSEVVGQRLSGPVPIPATLPVPWKLLLHGMLDQLPSERPDAPATEALLRSGAFDGPWNPLESLQAQATTALSPPGAVRAQATRSGHRRVGWSMAAAAFAVALVTVVALFGGSAKPADQRAASPAHRDPAGTSAKPSSSTGANTGTTAGTTTTTVPVTGPVALANLVRDVASGVSDQTISPATGQAISDAAEQAVTYSATGRTAKAANELQSAAMDIADGAGNGTITSTEVPVLQADLVTLADSLGLGAAAAAPVTTSPGPSASPGPANGSGNAHGTGVGKGGGPAKNH